MLLFKQIDKVLNSRIIVVKNTDVGTDKFEKSDDTSIFSLRF